MGQQRMIKALICQTPGEESWSPLGSPQVSCQLLEDKVGSSSSSSPAFTSSTQCPPLSQERGLWFVQRAEMWEALSLAENSCQTRQLCAHLSQVRLLERRQKMKPGDEAEKQGSSFRRLSPVLHLEQKQERPKLEGC